MKSIYVRYTKETVMSIEDAMVIYPSASEAARALGIDTSGLIKHVKKHRTLRETTERNKCGNKYKCDKHNEACESCIHMEMYGRAKRCQNCKINCNDTCSEFTKIPNCERLKKWPYCCNGCPKKETCRLCKFYYDAVSVWIVLESNRSESRKGPHADADEFTRLSIILKPLIIDKHQSLSQIFQTHKEELRWSYPTILKFIDQGLIPGIKNIDLPKRTKYPAKYKKKKDEPTNAAFITNRTYDDFIVFISEDTNVEVVEMDTVLSGRGDNACLLTLLFRKSNFMLAFKLDSKTSENVKKIFAWIRKVLGDDLFSKTFRCVLTDNGSEFADPLDIEFNEYGERLTQLFYCDPGKSGQKGKIEKNHVELRKIFPKGCSFSIYSQNDINLALQHVNSEPRGILNGNCPGIIARVFLDAKVISLNNFKQIHPDEVLLHPSLLRLK